MHKAVNLISFVLILHVLRSMYESLTDCLTNESINHAVKFG